MRKEEAETIGQLLEPYQFKTVINIGAGDVIKQKKINLGFSSAYSIRSKIKGLKLFIRTYFLLMESTY